MVRSIHNWFIYSGQRGQIVVLGVRVTRVGTKV